MEGSVKYWIQPPVCKNYSRGTKIEEKLFLPPLKCYLTTALINIWDTAAFYLKKISVFYVYFLLFLQYAAFLRKIPVRIKAIHSQTSLKRGQKENSRKNQHFRSYFTFSIMTLSAASQYEILLLCFTKCVTFFAVLRTRHSGGAAILRRRSSITGVRSFQTK